MESAKSPCYPTYILRISYVYPTLSTVYRLRGNMLYHYYFFHSAFVKSKSTVKISKRPISITKVATHFANAGKAAYVPPSGANCPIVTPMLPIAEIAVPIDTSKSKPVAQKTMVANTIIKK